MPLKLRIDGEFVRSDTYVDWEELRAQIKRGEVATKFMCCDHAKVILRTSVGGLQHFVHKAKPEDCNYKGTSPEHIALQLLLEQIFLDRGWYADVEHYSEKRNWIGDVYTEFDDRKVTAEIQLSSQTMDTTIFRTERCKKDGVETWWFFRRLNRIWMHINDNIICAELPFNYTNTNPNLRIELEGIIDKFIGPRSSDTIKFYHLERQDNKRCKKCRSVILWRYHRLEEKCAVNYELVEEAPQFETSTKIIDEGDKNCDHIYKIRSVGRWMWSEGREPMNLETTSPHRCSDCNKWASPMLISGI